VERIAFIVNALSHGGGQRVFVDDANAFAAAGARVLLCTLYRAADRDPLGRELAPSIETRWLRARGPFDVRAVMGTVRALRAADVTVVMTTLNDANVFGRWVVVASGFTIRLIRREGTSPRHKRVWQRGLDLLCDDLAHRIVAVSDETRADLIRLAPWRARRVIAVRNAVTPARPSPAIPPGSPPRLLTVGRLAPEKGHATLLAALGMLARAGHPFTADLIGDGALAERLRASARRAGLGERVAFRGALPHGDVLRAYGGADVLVLPSRWEGCPNAVLEAMAHGLPVVATAVGGVPELVEHEVSGLLVPPEDPAALADALARMLGDAELRAAMGRAGRSRAAMFAPGPRFALLRDLVAGASSVAGRRRPTGEPA
jgi:glycosyltransferase involved in cell wall biosynthesis